MKSRIRKPFLVEIRKRRGKPAIGSRRGAIAKLLEKLSTATPAPAARS